MNIDEQSEQEINATQVFDYLRQHPDFFSQYPALLNEINLQGESVGGTVSLAERQVSILQEKNKQLADRLQKLVDIARHNEALFQRMRQLILTLMSMSTLEEMIAALYEHLRNDFETEQVVLRLFAEPNDTTVTLNEFVSAEIEERLLFKYIIESRTPVSGQLEEQQNIFLFSEDSSSVASSVILPLQGNNWDGILAIGSSDSERFHAAMGVELLSYLGEVLSLILKQWIKQS